MTFLTTRLSKKQISIAPRQFNLFSPNLWSPQQLWNISFFVAINGPCFLFCLFVCFLLERRSTSQWERKGIEGNRILGRKTMVIKMTTSPLLGQQMKVSISCKWPFTENVRMFFLWTFHNVLDYYHSVLWMWKSKCFSWVSELELKPSVLLPIWSSWFSVFLNGL